MWALHTRHLTLFSHYFTCDSSYKTRRDYFPLMDFNMSQESDLSPDRSVSQVSLDTSSVINVTPTEFVQSSIKDRNGKGTRGKLFLVTEGDQIALDRAKTYLRVILSPKLLIIGSKGYVSLVIPIKTQTER